MSATHEAPKESPWYRDVMALLAVRLKDEADGWQIDLLSTGDRVTRVVPTGVLLVSCSHDSNEISDTWYDVIEVKARKGIPTEAELRGRMYTPSQVHEEQHILTIQTSGMLVVVICKEYQVRQLDREGRIPVASRSE